MNSHGGGFQNFATVKSAAWNIHEPLFCSGQELLSLGAQLLGRQEPYLPL